MTAVQSFCGRAVYLDHGRLVADGPTDAVVFQYEQHIQERRHHLEQEGLIYSLRYHNRDGNQSVRITRVRILDENGEERKEFEVGEPLTFECHFQNVGFDDPVIFNFAVSDLHRNMLFIGSTREDNLPIPKLPKEGVLRVSFPSPALVAGVYTLSFGFFDNEVDFYALDFRNHVLDLQKFKYSFIIRRMGLAWKSGGGIFLHRSWRLEENGKVIGEAKE
jgi:lipopolysaccharide transport system ATP-binding protein